MPRTNAERLVAIQQALDAEFGEGQIVVERIEGQRGYTSTAHVLRGQPIERAYTSYRRRRYRNDELPDCCPTDLTLRDRPDRFVAQAKIYVERAKQLLWEDEVTEQHDEVAHAVPQQGCRECEEARTSTLDEQFLSSHWEARQFLVECEKVVRALQLASEDVTRLIDRYREDPVQVYTIADDGRAVPTVTQILETTQSLQRQWRIDLLYAYAYRADALAKEERRLREMGVK